MTYQEAWKIILGAVENTYEDSVKDALKPPASRMSLKEYEKKP